MTTEAENEVFREFTERVEGFAGEPLPAPELLRRALTHSSAEPGEQGHNERLEFLGDSVLGLAITHWLFDALPQAREGELTERRAHLVSRRVASHVARRLGLHQQISTGRSLGGRAALPPSLVGNALEALIGAVFLQVGFDPCRNLVAALYEPELRAASGEDVPRNEKMRLQEWAQQRGSELPVYALLGQGGPPFARAFRMQVVHAGRRFPTAWGRTKRQAERLAAREALRVLRKEGLLLEDDVDRRALTVFDEEAD